jgi:carboxypeptidase Taq
MTALDQLKEVLVEVTDLMRVAELLFWDQETYMPRGGVQARASQSATVSRLAHERFTSTKMGDLLGQAESETAALPWDSNEASLVRVTRRDYDYEVKLPSALVGEMARTHAEAQPVWAEARRTSNWKLFAPHMQVTVNLARQVADAYDGQTGPLDALISRHEPGVTGTEVHRIFDQLKAVIVPLVHEIGERSEAVDDSMLDRHYDPERQIAFALKTVAKLGYDLERGRQDLSRHPFMVSFGPGDVRITTRAGSSIRDSCLFSSIHESGHAMYEQGIASELDGTPLCSGASSGVHESQSRLWENLIGRSQPFWRYFYPHLRAAFPEALADVDEETFVRAVNKVQPSYIRVDSDEVTYNLHIMLRTEIEKDLLEGRLKVEEVPEAWNAKVGQYLGMPPPPDANGCLQDIHWTSPMLGGFVGYTLGNVISAQLMETIRTELPHLDHQVAAGEFGALLRWLRSNLYGHGRKFTPNEILEQVTGRPITVEPWIDYIRRKYSELYGL